jgi:Flp pilus assembly protein TadD
MATFDASATRASFGGRSRVRIGVGSCIAGLGIVGALHACGPAVNAPQHGAVPPEGTSSAPAASTQSLAAGQRLVDLVAEVEARSPVETAPIAATPPRGLTRGVGDEADRQLALGDAATLRQDHSRALEHYRKARKLLARHPAPVVGIVNARFALLGIPFEFAAAPKDKRLSELFGLLDQAAQLEPNFGPLALARGRLLLVQGQAPEAEKQLTLAARLLPNDPEVVSGLAIARLAQGNVDLAVEGFARAVELDGNNSQHLGNLGAVLILKQQLPQAIETLRRAVMIAPEEARLHSDLGTALLASGQLEAALPELQRAQALRPERATFMSNLGYAYQLKGDLVQAESWCRRAITADPKLGSAWLNLGVVQAANKQWDEAERAFKRAERIDPTDPRPAANLQDLAEVRRGP